MLSVLMVAEKPSIAEAVARALGSDYNKTFRTSNASPIFEYKGQFLGREAKFKVTSTTGHVFTTDFSGQYNNWEAVDPTELFDAPIATKEANPKTRIASHIATEAKGVDVLVLWLDCDREGENICFEVMGLACPKMNKQTPNLCTQTARGVPPNVFRVKFSSLVASDLRKAFLHNLTLPNVCEAESVDARQEMDLKIGVAFTRFLTKYFLNRYGDLDSNLISYGPCQLPTLWFCVNQKEAHDRFEPETYQTFTMVVDVKGQQYTLMWDGGIIFDQNAAKVMKVQLDKIRQVKLVSRKTSPRGVKRPLPLNTVALLKAASSICGIGPQRAMHVAEQLYLRGLITYPRTESSAFPSAYDLRGTLEMLKQSPIGGTMANRLVTEGRFGEPRRGQDAGDHPPIAPCGKPAPGSLDGEQEQIFRLVAEGFLATCAGDAKYDDTRLIFEGEIPDHKNTVHSFQLRSSVLREPGFLLLSQKSRAVDVDSLTNLSIGQTAEVVVVKMEAGQTNRPPLLSESSLLGLMEKHGIGTDASMATHVQNILDRRYVSLAGTHRQLDPTKLGSALCNGLLRVDPELARPVVRGIIENQCSLIARGKADKVKVVRHVLSEFTLKFQHLLRQINVVDILFEVSFTTLAESGSPMTRCGTCKRYLSYVPKKPQRLICKHCAVVFRLPLNALSVRAWSDYRCPYDQFETVLVTERSGKAYTLCPMCYNDPPQAGLMNLNCLNCPHGECELAPAVKKIEECFQDNCTGYLYVQDWPGVTPALVCSRCDLMERFDQERVKTVSKAKRWATCEQCGWALVKATLSKANRFDDGTAVKTGCLGCDSELSGLLVGTGAGRTYGRGRGGFARRGRGRGRRRKLVDPKMTFDRF